MKLCRILCALTLLLAMAATGVAREHKVLRGETFQSIARQYGVSEQALRDANPRHKNCLAGLRLAIPDPPPPPPKPEPKPAPAPQPKPVAATQPPAPAPQPQYHSQPQPQPQPQTVQERYQCRMCKGTGRCVVCKGTGRSSMPPLVLGGGALVYEPSCPLCGGHRNCTTCGGTGYMTREREIYNQAIYEARQMERQERNSGSDGLNLRYPEYQQYNDKRGNFDNRKYQQERQKRCNACGGTGVNPYPDTGPAGSRISHFNPEGTKCKYCGKYYSHHHDKCASCVP